MRSLTEIQQEFARAILSGTGAAIDFVSGPISSQQALGVHRNTVLGALIGALRLTYPTVDHLVGEEFFDQAGLAYVDGHLPSNARLAIYGEEFPDFLLTYEPAASLSYLADVARLDQAIDRATLGPGDSARKHFAIDDNVSVDLPEGLCVLCLNYPADLIKDALDGDDDVALGTIDLQSGVRWLLVWRVGRQIVVKHVASTAGAFLQALLSGSPANRALAAAAAQSSFEIATKEIQRDIFAATFCRVTTRTGEQSL